VSKSFLTPIKFPVFSFDPIGTSYGEVYLNSVTSQLRYFDGQSWNDFFGYTVTDGTSAPHGTANPIDGGTAVTPAQTYSINGGKS
jgi:hypothetical protein